MGISSTQLGSDSGFARRLTIFATTMMMFVVLTASPASAWTVAECSFNSFFGGNTAQAVTNDSNFQCDDLWAKVLYKQDGIWIWSSSARNYESQGVKYNFAVKRVLGADDADKGKHKATSNSGGLSTWKYSY